MTRVSFVAAVLAFCVCVDGNGLVAQERDLLLAPADQWRVVLDRANGGDPPRLTTAESGLDVLTGASSILYQPDASFTDDYTIHIVLHQFDPSRRNEGFGIIFGGESLTSRTQQRYTYFLIRQDGSSLVKVRNGPNTRVVRDWMANPVQRSWESRDPGSEVVANDLTVEVLGEAVRFLINDEELWQVPRGELPSDGIVGLRVNHGLRIRVTGMAVRR